MCYAMDSGNRYAPEDALLPGSYPEEGFPSSWSAVINSELQPTVGLRWLLCYEEHDHDVVHLQKAAPQRWFSPGEVIRVRNCPTRFGPISWSTQAIQPSAGSARWKVEVSFTKQFDADLIVHIHPADRAPLRSASLGEVHPNYVVLAAKLLAGKTQIDIEVV
jgi:hypothetical protein